MGVYLAIRRNRGIQQSTGVFRNPQQSTAVYSSLLQSTAVYCSLLQSIRRFLVTDGRVCGRDVRSSEGVWGRREPSKVHSRLHRLHEFVQRLNHCSPAVAGSARSAMQNGGGGLAGAPSGLAESPGIRLTRDLRRAFPTMRPRSA